MNFRVPTGDTFNFNGVSSITPNYEFWANWWRGLVLRGGVGFFIPYGDQSIDEVGARTAFTANLAAGYYFTPHDLTPIGDLVWYLSTNLVQLIDDRGPNRSLVTLTPGFRTHLGRNWYLLGAVEVPVTRDAEKSGFLGDYSVLQPGGEGQVALRYVNPNARFASYDKILIEPVSIWATDKSSLNDVSEGDRKFLR